MYQFGVPPGGGPPTHRSRKLHWHTHTPSHTDTMKHPETLARAPCWTPDRSRGATPAPPGEVEASEGAGEGWGWGERSREEGREEGEGLLGNRCQCDCYGNWPSWGGAGRGRGAPGPLSSSSRPQPRGGGGGGSWDPSGSGGVGSPEPDAAETLLRPLVFHGAPCPLFPAWCGGVGSETQSPSDWGSVVAPGQGGCGRHRQGARVCGDYRPTGNNLEGA